MKKKGTGKQFWMLILAVIMIAGCSTMQKMPSPTELTIPTPILNNSGEYMCPYTQDGVVAMWCDKAVNASIGSSIGSIAGAYAGQKALEQVPFVGGFLGQKAGSAIGRKVAIEASGGWDYIKETSDMSFKTIDEMIVWIYATKHNSEHYDDVNKAVSNIYPEFNKRFVAAIKAARQN